MIKIHFWREVGKTGFSVVNIKHSPCQYKAERKLTSSVTMEACHRCNSHLEASYCGNELSAVSTLATLVSRRSMKTPWIMNMM